MGADGSVGQTGFLHLSECRMAPVVEPEPFQPGFLPDLVPLPRIFGHGGRKLDSQIRSKTNQRFRLTAQFGDLTLSAVPTESELHGYQQQKGQLQEQIQHLDLEIDNLKQRRKQTQHHIPVKSLPEQDRFTRLRTERKHFVDTIKMISYRAETCLASLLREHLARSDDARSLLRQIFNNEVDLLPGFAANTLTVRLHHLAQAAHDQAIAKLCFALSETQTIFPGTDLKLIFEIGSSGIPPDQEV
jgi:hypothetical protein